VVELAHTTVLEAVAERLAGSSPVPSISSPFPEQARTNPPISLKLSTERKVSFAFAAAVAVLLGVSGAAWWNAARSKAAFRLVDHTHEVLSLLDQAMNRLLALQAASRGFALTANEALLEGYDADEAALHAASARVRKLVADNPAQLGRLDRLEPILDRVVVLQRERISARRAGGLTAVTQARANPTGRPMIDLAGDLIGEMESEERRLLAGRIADSQAAASATIGVIFASCGLAVVFATLAGLYIQRDLAERRRIEHSLGQSSLQLQAANRQLVSANAELEAFSYSVSHDLRAPLRHIDGFAGMLEKHAGPALDEKGRRYVTTVRQAARQMGQLIDDLLGFSRLSRASLALGEVDQDALLAAVIAGGHYGSAEHTILWEISPLPRVRADAAMIRQVWANLVDNAVKYSRHAAPARISIACQLSGGANPEHVFSVRDNGVGFDPAYASQLFGVFQRLHDSAQFEGTGIGLANVRRIVARHGGRTWAESEVGKGASFFFSLPVTPYSPPLSA
jgi:signal transduction histidine kinase